MSAPTIAVSDPPQPQLGQLIDLLRDQSTCRLDVKAGSGRMRAAGGQVPKLAHLVAPGRPQPLDAANGQDAAQDADRLPTLPPRHPQPATCQHAYVVVTGEPVVGTIGTAGSGRGPLEKDLITGSSQRPTGAMDERVVQATSWGCSRMRPWVLRSAKAR
jgi:hypothetical protein